MTKANDRILQLYLEVLELSDAEQVAYLEQLEGTDPESAIQLRGMVESPNDSGRFDLLVEQLSEASTPLNPIQSPEVVHRTIGKYTIQDRIGGGGMGIVYKAFDSRLQRTVAVKFLRADLTANTEAKARLLVEARSAAGLDHPNVCTVYEVGETDDGSLYLVMPFYKGETLREKIQAGPLPVQEATGYIRQVAAGLQQAHALGIVHRDIKPANLLVTPKGLVKILDFGIAKRTEDQLTKQGSRLGTLAYMSPEQLQSEAVDHSTDIWALGVVLFELLTGKRPFHGEYEYALMYSLLHEDPILLSSLLQDASTALENTICKALEKDKGHRFQDVAAFLNALDSPVNPPLSIALHLPLTPKLDQLELTGKKNASRLPS